MSETSSEASARDRPWAAPPGGKKEAPSSAVARLVEDSAAAVEACASVPENEMLLAAPSGEMKGGSFRSFTGRIEPGSVHRLFSDVVSARIRPDGAMVLAFYATLKSDRFAVSGASSRGDVVAKKGGERLVV